MKLNIHFAGKIIILFLLLLIFRGKNILSQDCGNLNIQLRSEITSACSTMVMTALHDQSGRNYLYVANKEAGLTIYNISDISTPVLAATVPTTLFDNLDVMNLSQYGNYLYLAIGNSFTNPQPAGMAIIDVTNPETPVVTDYYVVPGSESGGGIIKVENNYAYLGAMMSGLVIFDISDKNNIQFIKQFLLDINYPPVFNPIPDKYNARGMEVRNDIVYLCYDAGGIRIINCVDKNNPVQTGWYANITSYIPINLPRAYNNIILDDTLAYVAIDYCGMEILNISDTSNIELVGWWNPYNCPDNFWVGCPVHANELYYDKNCSHIFLAAGKSDMYVLDVSDPESPDSCDSFGNPSDSMATWGINVYDNQIYLAYICSPYGIPFYADWTGVKLFTYTSCSTGINDGKEQINNFQLFQNYPNPFNPSSTIKFDISKTSYVTLKVYDILGKEVITLVNEELNPGHYEKTFNATGLSSGTYFYKIQAGEFTSVKKMTYLK